MMNKFIVFLLLLIIPFLFFVYDYSSNNNKNEIVKIDNPFSLFPLEIGNFWEYKRKSFSENCFYINNKIDKNGNIVDKIAAYQNDLKNEHFETYTIIHMKNNNFRCEVIKSSSKSKNPIRDGRYEKINKIEYFWKQDRNFFKTEIQKELFECLKNNKMTNYACRSLIVLDPEMGLLSFENSNSNCKIETKFIKEGNVIKVPAGTFKCRFKTVKTVFDINNNDLMYCETVSYWCPDVGMIKEIQKLKEDKISYVLELSKYKVNKTNKKVDVNVINKNIQKYQAIKWLKSNIVQSDLKPLIISLENAIDNTINQEWIVGNDLTKNQKTYIYSWNDDYFIAFEVNSAFSGIYSSKKEDLLLKHKKNVIHNSNSEIILIEDIKFTRRIITGRDKIIGELHCRVNDDSIADEVSISIDYDYSKFLTSKYSNTNLKGKGVNILPFEFSSINDSEMKATGVIKLIFYISTIPGGIKNKPVSLSNDYIFIFFI